MVTSFIRVSVSGRNVFSLTGSFSSSSRVSRPSIILHVEKSMISCHYELYSNSSVTVKHINQVSKHVSTIILTKHLKKVAYFPNTVYFMSRWGCLAYVKKNWEPFVLGPLLAIETTPLTLCWNKKRLMMKYKVKLAPLM